MSHSIPTTIGQVRADLAPPQAAAQAGAPDPSPRV